MSKPQVSVIVATHLAKNQPYLDLCLRSLANQKGVDFETVVVSSGEYQPVLPKGIKGVHSCDRLHYPSAINKGAEWTDPNSKYLLLLNDDTILSENAIAQLVWACGDNQAILNPLSNCDIGWRYFAAIPFTANDGETLLCRRQHRFDEVKKFAPQIMAPYQAPPVLLPVDFVCFYATLIPRTVWNAVGPIDPAYQTGFDDQDYCYRAREKGILSLIALNSFIFHFSGVSADQVLTPENRAFNENYFREKWKGKIA